VCGWGLMVRASKIEPSSVVVFLCVGISLPDDEKRHFCFSLARRILMEFTHGC
jgi:hypothetical protein